MQSHCAWWNLTMRICLIAEGSYPYVIGGVSNWIHSLIREMPEYEFIVLAIGADSKHKGAFKYSLPANLVEVKEIFLDECQEKKRVRGRKARLHPEHQQAIFSLIGGGGTPVWGHLFNFMKSSQFKHAAELMNSKSYFDLVTKLGQDVCSSVPFTELLRMANSMITPLYTALRQEIPQADLYHCVSTGYAGMVGAMAKHLYGKPLLLTEHGIYSREREEEIIRAEWIKPQFKNLWIRYFCTLSMSIYEAADEVIELFDGNKELAIEMGCPEEKIRVIPNGVNIADYNHLMTAPNDGRIRIGAIVRIVPIKDIKTMLRSYQLIENAVPEAELHVMGPTDEDEGYYEECLQLVQSLGIKNIQFTGFVDIREYMGRMDLLLLTSISEGQPLAILEGMACSKPFVTTTVGSCQELIEGKADETNGPAGFLVPVKDVEKIAQKSIILCRDRSLRETMGRNGYNRVSSLYKKSSFIDRYREIYRLSEG